jgi:hypothetical protein
MVIRNSFTRSDVLNMYSRIYNDASWIAKPNTVKKKCTCIYGFRRICYVHARNYVLTADELSIYGNLIWSFYVDKKKIVYKKGGGGKKILAKNIVAPTSLKSGGGMPPLPPVITPVCTNICKGVRVNELIRKQLCFEQRRFSDIFL